MGLESEHSTQAQGINRDQKESDRQTGSHKVIENGQQPDGIPEGSQSTSGADVEATQEKPLKLEVVPRSERRGLLSSCLLVPEVSNPYQYSNATKWLMTAIVALAAMTSSTGSSIFYPALPVVAQDLNTSKTVTNLSLAFYMLAMAITPLWSMYSELLGRRTIYIVSFTFFVIFAIISAVSVNIAMLIVFRLLAGGAAASVQAVGSGTIADVWEPKVRGRAMGIFFIGPLCGPGIAPIIGGGLTDGFGWRSTQWFLVIFGGVLMVLILLCLPETVKRKSETEKQQPKPKMTLGSFLKTCVKPLEVLGLLRYPPVVVAIWAGALNFGVTFLLYVSIQANFSQPPYSFSTTKIGLLYLAPTIGYGFSSVLGGRWVDRIMAREAKKAGRYDDNGKLKYLPEDRMKENMWISAILYPAMFIWYGWSVQYRLQWAVSAVASLVYGALGMILYGAVTTVLTEFTPNRSSSGIALNNFVRNILSTIAAVAAQAMIDAMGTGWMCTMAALFALVTTLGALALLKTHREQWRVKMDKKLNQKG